MMLNKLSSKVLLLKTLNKVKSRPRKLTKQSKIFLRNQRSLLVLLVCSLTQRAEWRKLRRMRILSRTQHRALLRMMKVRKNSLVKNFWNGKKTQNLLTCLQLKKLSLFKLQVQHGPKQRIQMLLTQMLLTQMPRKILKSLNQLMMGMVEIPQ